MSQRSTSKPSMLAPNYGQHSTCSSETANRILALQLQLEMEQKRRKDVERALLEFSAGRPMKISNNNTCLPPLSEKALKEFEGYSAANSQNSQKVVMMSTSERAGKGRVEPAADVPIPTQPSRGGTKQMTREVSPLPNKSVRKPPLPREAIPQSHTSPATRFGKHRTSDLDIYLSRQRHEARMAALKAFEL